MKPSRPRALVGIAVACILILGAGTALWMSSRPSQNANSPTHGRYLIMGMTGFSYHPLPGQARGYYSGHQTRIPLRTANAAGKLVGHGEFLDGIQGSLSRILIKHRLTGNRFRIDGFALYAHIPSGGIWMRVGDNTTYSANVQALLAQDALRARIGAEGSIPGLSG